MCKDETKHEGLDQDVKPTIWTKRRGHVILAYPSGDGGVRFCPHNSTFHPSLRAEVNWAWTLMSDSEGILCLSYLQIHNTLRVT
jgi:hypothetical protein